MNIEKAEKGRTAVLQIRGLVPFFDTFCTFHEMRRMQMKCIVLVQCQAALCTSCTNNSGESEEGHSELSESICGCIIYGTYYVERTVK